jgi:hypothetical protein
MRCSLREAVLVFRGRDGRAYQRQTLQFKGSRDGRRASGCSAFNSYLPDRVVFRYPHRLRRNH